MTALNFPNSPVNGQTYEGYTYNATKGVWEINVVTPGIGGLVGVDIDAPATGQLLRYDGTNWANHTPDPVPQSGNVIINGDFGVWQRGTSGFPLGGSYNSDRWSFYTGTATNKAITRETLAPGDVNAIGYGAGEFFWRLTESVATVADTNLLSNRIEDARTLAGQTVTFSFWARSSTSSSTVVARLARGFGTGGSASDSVEGTTIALSTSWARYSQTLTLPSVVGKTIGANSFLAASLRFSTNLIQTIDVWGVQLEAGNTATPFRLAGGGSKGAELALCQRYYYRVNALNTRSFASGFANRTTQARGVIYFKQTMRVEPTELEQTGTAANYFVQRQETATIVCSGVPTIVNATEESCVIQFTVASGLTAGEGLNMRSNADTAFLAWSAEL